MEITLEEIKANHKRIMDKHESFRLRDTVLTILMIASVLATVVYSSIQPSNQVCTSIACQVSPWILTTLLISIVTVYALAMRSKERGITAYYEAMIVLEED